VAINLRTTEKRITIREPWRLSFHLSME